MTTVVRSTNIPAPVDDVWKVLAEFDTIAAWAPNVDHSCLLSEQTEGVGMVRRIQTGRATVVETVEVYEPPATLGYAITGLPAVIRSVTNTWTLASDGNGTLATLTTEVDAGSRPPQRAVAKAVGRTLANTSDQMLEGLADHFRKGNAT